MSDKQEQMEIVGQLQKLLLEDYLRLLRSGEATPADRAALGKLLSANGWSLDDRDVPKGVKSFLTKSVDPRKFDREDEMPDPVIGRIA